jgi:hypothetical protein
MNYPYLYEFCLGKLSTIYTATASYLTLAYCPIG